MMDFIITAAVLAFEFIHSGFSTRVPLLALEDEMINPKQALLLVVLAITAACASAQEAQIFHEADLESLVDQPIPGSKLVGTFIYLGESRSGFPTFSSFTTTDGRIEFGNVLLIVQFPNGLPPTLSVGKVIKPDLEHPLTIELVKRTADGNFIVVRARYQEKT
jgi:hypothetical protein